VGVDVRVIAATNKDLNEEIATGRFRQDLLFRINVIPIRVPGLDQRREDIPLLVEEFMRHFSRQTGVRPKSVSQEAMAILQAYDWPGNVREVRNLVERLMIMVADDEITPAALDIPVAASVSGDGGSLTTLRDARSNFEREYIGRVVTACGGNMSRAARVLGLERSHLYRKLRALGLRAR
jgi:two-component system nitrogen regulation response regulator NtrX